MLVERIFSVKLRNSTNLFFSYFHFSRLPNCIMINSGTLRKKQYQTSNAYKHIITISQRFGTHQDKSCAPSQNRYKKQCNGRFPVMQQLFFVLALIIQQIVKSYLAYPFVVPPYSVKEHCQKIETG